MEIAYVSSNKIFIEIEKRQNDFLAKVLKRLTKKTFQIHCNHARGEQYCPGGVWFFMGDLLMAWLEGMRPLESAFLNYLVTDLSLFTQTIISTLIILLTAEFLPKVFFQIYANSMLKLFAIPAYLFFISFLALFRLL